jgi:hypothetical protein
MEALRLLAIFAIIIVVGIIVFHLSGGKFE